MIYFDPKPNYERISRYGYEWPGTPEQMQLANPDGYLISVDWWQTLEQVESVEQSFKEILVKYNLIEFYDDLLLLVLTKYVDADEEIRLLEQDYLHRKRVKELAALILLIKQTPIDKFNKLSMASVFDSAKISDPHLTGWIGQLIIDSLEKGTYLISLLGFVADDMFFEEGEGKKVLSIEKLKATTDLKLKSPKSKVRGLQADLCFSLYTYLVGETDIKPDANTILSDRLCLFYFDVLELLGYVHHLQIESTPKDFMRAILMNRFKQLNPSFKGK